MTGGSTVEDDECEVAVFERFKPAKSGVWARVTSVHGDPIHVSETVSNFTQNIVPVIEKQPGVWTALFFVNRQDRQGVRWVRVGHRDGPAEERSGYQWARAETIKKLSGRDARTEAFEIYVTEILAPAALAV